MKKAILYNKKAPSYLYGSSIQTDGEKKKNATLVQAGQNSFSPATNRQNRVDSFSNKYGNNKTFDPVSNTINPNLANKNTAGISSPENTAIKPKNNAFGLTPLKTGETNNGQLGKDYSGGLTDISKGTKDLVASDSFLKPQKNIDFSGAGAQTAFAAAGNIAGLAASHADDGRADTNTKKEAAGTIGSSVIQGAAAGASTGALPAIAIGAAAGLVTGLIKNSKNKKAAGKESDRLNIVSENRSSEKKKQDLIRTNASTQADSDNILGFDRNKKNLGYGVARQGGVFIATSELRSIKNLTEKKD